MASIAPTTTANISEKDYARIRTWLYREAGIELGSKKHSLVCGRLAKRVADLGLSSYGEYCALIERDSESAERQRAVDLLTTNETYFYRESRHFEQLSELASEFAAKRQPMRVWSAACSSGEEVYTLAMVLEEVASTHRGFTWHVHGSDISERVLEAAQRGIYPESRAAQLPDQLKRRYCLKGSGPAQGQMLVAKKLRQAVSFASANLLLPAEQRDCYDVVFLRNVLIYFDPQTKQKVVANVSRALVPGGHLFVGMAESLNGLNCGLEGVSPGMYRKPISA